MNNQLQKTKCWQASSFQNGNFFFFFYKQLLAKSSPSISPLRRCLLFLFFLFYIIINIKNSSLLKRKGTTVGDEFKPALCCGGGPGNKKHKTTNIFLSMLSSYRKKFPSYVMISMYGNTDVVDRDGQRQIGSFILYKMATEVRHPCWWADYLR